MSWTMSTSYTISGATADVESMFSVAVGVDAISNVAVDVQTISGATVDV